MMPEPSISDVVRPIRPVGLPAAPTQPVGGWGTDSGAYSPHQFYTESADKETGARSWVRVAIPPRVASQIAQLIQQRRVPEYRTREDLVRDALMHRLEYIAQLLDDRDLEGALRLEMSMARLAQIKEAQDREKGYVDMAIQTLQDASGNGVLLERAIEEIDTTLHLQKDLTEANRARLDAEVANYRSQRD